MKRQTSSTTRESLLSGVRLNFGLIKFVRACPHRHRDSECLHQVARRQWPWTRSAQTHSLVDAILSLGHRVSDNFCRELTQKCSNPVSGYHPLLMSFVGVFLTESCRDAGSGALAASKTNCATLDTQEQVKACTKGRETACSSSCEAHGDWSFVVALGSTR